MKTNRKKIMAWLCALPLISVIIAPLPFYPSFTPGDYQGIVVVNLQTENHITRLELISKTPSMWSWSRPNYSYSEYDLKLTDLSNDETLIGKLNSETMALTLNEKTQKNTHSNWLTQMGFPKGSDDDLSELLKSINNGEFPANGLYHLTTPLAGSIYHISTGQIGSIWLCIWFLIWLLIGVVIAFRNRNSPRTA